MSFHQPSSESELKELLTKYSVCVVDFFATWCGPCKVLSTKLHEHFSHNHTPDVAIIKLDVDIPEFADLSEKFGVSGLPTVEFFKNNKHYKEMGVVGCNPTKVIENVGKLLNH